MGTHPTPTARQRAAGRLWALLVFFLAAVLTLTTAAGNATTASASTTETRVGVCAPVSILAVGVPEHIAAGQHPDRGPPQSGPAEGRGVHTFYVTPQTADDADGPVVLVHNSDGESCGIGEYLAKKAPTQVRPEIRELSGQYKNDLGRVEPGTAHYDEYGRQIGRTDYNAGNRTEGIPDTHYHVYEYGPGKQMAPVEDHVPGEFPG